MVRKSVFDKVVDVILGSAVRSTVKSAVNDTFEEVERKVLHVTSVVLKVLTVYLFVFVGALFFLVGLGDFLSVRLGWSGGVSFLVIGSLLVFVGLVSGLLSR